MVIALKAFLATAAVFFALRASEPFSVTINVFWVAFAMLDLGIALGWKAREAKAEAELAETE